jgi:DinB family protein
MMLSPTVTYQEVIMSTATRVRTATPSGLDPNVLARVVEEGYGPGAWHGPDLKAALSDVTPELAFWRPAQGRHNIAEIALHHAYYVRSVRAQLSGTTPEPFVLEGEDWFECSDSGTLTWPDILGVVDLQQRRLATAVADVAAGRSRRSSADVEPFDVVLGITCHAVYHAGQVQLIKRLGSV